MQQENWQILDVGSVWMKEFASALAKLVETTAWCPQMSYFGGLQNWELAETLSDPSLDVIRFPLQRGYHRAPYSWVAPFEAALLRRIQAHCSNPEVSPLICSTPFYAPLAEKWGGPIIYYVTDLTVAYDGLNADQVVRLDRRMCKVARVVCPNSSRIAKYLHEEAGCPEEKICIIPNATRASNLSKVPLLDPAGLPPEIAHLRRPIAGVIGNLAANMDWEFIRLGVQLTPSVNWVFVGPITMAIDDPVQAEARSWVIKRCHFTGAKTYGELQTYARCFDVAVLPYRKKEPTYSGSSTRFYEHLAACRPMVATRGFAELLEKPPLVELVDSAMELEQALKRLKTIGYRDGFEILRWEASQHGTWEERAKTMVAALHESTSRKSLAHSSSS